jgi:ubiquinone/menaquinone biosynthesis C-methylase UbiE
MAATIAAYDEAADAYQQYWRERRPRDAIRRFAELAGRGSRVLDAACGPALDVRLLADAGLSVVAGDVAGGVMQVAKTLFPKSPVARWDLRQLPFADETFDGVWAAAALQHLPRDGIRSALAELTRVQRAGPVFASFRRGEGDLEAVEDPPAGTVYATTVSADECKALLLDAGYRNVEV